MRLARGSGLTGAAGMRPRRGAWIKPLLHVTRAELESDLRRHDSRGATTRATPAPPTCAIASGTSPCPRCSTHSAWRRASRHPARGTGTPGVGACGRAGRGGAGARTTRGARTASRGDGRSRGYSRAACRAHRGPNARVPPGTPGAPRRTTSPPSPRSPSRCSAWRSAVPGAGAGPGEPGAHRRHLGPMLSALSGATGTGLNLPTVPGGPACGLEGMFSRGKFSSRRRLSHGSRRTPLNRRAGPSDARLLGIRRRARTGPAAGRTARRRTPRPTSHAHSPARPAGTLERS
jgi:hypothetical protein